MNYPDKDSIYPVSDCPEICFLKISLLKISITNPNIIIGYYTYYHSFKNPLDFEKNIIYNATKDKLIIGKFCFIIDRLNTLM